jgi:hypothetical protein
VSNVLTGPLLVAAVVVCVAAVAKLRSPSGAVRALFVIGLPARAWHVRALAVLELALGGAALLAPSPLPAAALAGLYAAFALVTIVLQRRQATCGCFGAGDASATTAGWLLSATLALVCAAAARWAPHGLAWMLGRPAPLAAALAFGIGGSAYATVVAYTQLPVAWGAWSAR